MLLTVLPLKNVAPDVNYTAVNAVNHDVAYVADYDADYADASGVLLLPPG